jgi:hypothetical protein
MLCELTVTLTWYSPIWLAYGIEAISPIKLEVIILWMAMRMMWLDVSQQHMLLRLNELDEMQLHIQHNIEFP